jgi:hypothetical protein
MPWPDSGVGRNAVSVSARAVSVLGMGQQVEVGDRYIVCTPEAAGLSLRTARREGAGRPDPIRGGVVRIASLKRSTSSSPPLLA